MLKIGWLEELKCIWITHPLVLLESVFKEDAVHNYNKPHLLDHMIP